MKCQSVKMTSVLRMELKSFLTNTIIGSREKQLLPYCKSKMQLTKMFSKLEDVKRACIFHFHSLCPYFRMCSLQHTLYFESITDSLAVVRQKAYIQGSISVGKILGYSHDKLSPVHQKPYRRQVSMTINFNPST